MISDMKYEMTVLDSKGAGGLHYPPLGQYIHFFLSCNIHALTILYTFTLP